MDATAGRLMFQVRPSTGAVSPTDGPLAIDVGRDGVLYVPETAERGAPPLVFFHGAGGTGRRELRAVVAAADRYGAVVMAPDSRAPTWDVIMGGFGPDVEFLDRALDAMVERCDVDMSRLAVGGISDGASYALSIGVTNGDIFGAVIAYSPGFLAAKDVVGQPRIFVSHGTMDPVLPIDQCSRTIVGAMQDAGYEVTYSEFDGGHTVPPLIADQGFAWWLGSP